MKTYCFIIFIATCFIIFYPAIGQSEPKVFQVAGHSMEPVLMPGDNVVVDESFYENNHPKRDDLVAVKLGNRKNLMVKRVKAVTGDNVSFHNDTLWINDKKIRRINPKKWQSTIKQVEHYGNVVPKNTVLVLGDNPKNSRDSGRLGLISVDQLAGKVIRINHGQ